MFTKPSPGEKVRCTRDLSNSPGSIGTTGVVVASRPDVPGSGGEPDEIHILMEDGNYATFHKHELEEEK